MPGTAAGFGGRAGPDASLAGVYGATACRRADDIRGWMPPGSGETQMRFRWGGSRLRRAQPEASHELQRGGPKVPQTPGGGRPSDRSVGGLAKRRGRKPQPRVGIPGNRPPGRLSSCRHEFLLLSQSGRANRDLPKLAILHQRAPTSLGHEALSDVDGPGSTIDAYMKDRQRLPQPSKGRVKVNVPPLTVPKIELYNAMQQKRITKAELGRRLGWHMPQVDRVLDVRHASRMDRLQQALQAVDRRLEVTVVEA